MTHDFGTNVEVRRVSNAVAAGTSDINGTGVDMTGYAAVEFIALFGTLTANQVTLLKIQQSSDDGSADAYDDLAGTSTGAMADGDSYKILRTGVVRPLKRYVRPVIDRGTANAVVDGIIALLYRASYAPVPLHSTQSKATKTVESPAEGTA